MPKMIFQYGREPVLIQRKLIGFEAILESFIRLTLNFFVYHVYSPKSYCTNSTWPIFLFILKRKVNLLSADG